jgi:hypothetical protein
MTAMYVLSVSRIGDCINLQIGYEEETAIVANKEVSQIVQQIIQIIYQPMKRQVTKASICLSEDEYEIMKPAVGDEVEVEVKEDSITFKLIR